MFQRKDKDGNVIRYDKAVIDCSNDEVRVEQSHKAEVDINNIVAKHGIDLIKKVNALQQFTYDDVSGNDFQETMNAIIKAGDSFKSIDSNIRKFFDNDPAKFMDYIHNPENKEQLVKWGLMKPEQEIQPMHVIVDNPTVEAPPVKEPVP